MHQTLPQCGDVHLVFEEQSSCDKNRKVHKMHKMHNKTLLHASMPLENCATEKQNKKKKN